MKRTTKAMKSDLTAEFVRSVLDYDKATGVLRWKTGRCIGKVAGCPALSGHLTVRINYSLYLVHRLVWLIVTGEWPPLTIDHKDTDATNNRFENLRLSTQVQNSGNSRLSRRNTSGFKGVSWCKSKGKWEAYIGSGGGKIKHLGRFNRPEDAHAAYCDAAKEKFGEFFNDGRQS